MFTTFKTINKKPSNKMPKNEESAEKQKKKISKCKTF